MEAVFRALGDGNRRAILDKLFARDGLRLGELCENLQMTRFGVMKHVRVLEQAGLVRTLRRGREKLHYLNAAPLRRLHESWMSKYEARWNAHG